MVGDAIRSKIVQLPRIKRQLQAMGVPPVGYFYTTKTGSPEQLNRQSFIFLKELQNVALGSQRRRFRYVGKDLKYRTVSTPSIMVALQSVHGYGVLPYLYREGAYGEGKLVKYVDGKLVKGRAFRSGVRGADHPVYGFTIAHFISQLRTDPRIRALIPAGAKTPVTDAVVRDFSAGTGLFGQRPKS